MVTLDLLEIVVTAFALFALSRVMLRMKDGKITKKEGFFWCAVWVLAIVLVFVKDYLNLLQDFISTRRPVDAIIYISIILLFYLVFRIYVKLDQMEQDITTIVRNRAIQRARKK
ncbi:DUF2304 family protein [Candidatus Woesearchaeota archaeon]|nr:DUF2304 family protein [Candidatus Woesearchaeota archaeon]